MINATGFICDLNHGYCYYLSKEQLPGTGGQWRISDKILENFIKQYIEQQNVRTLPMKCWESQDLFTGSGEYPKNCLLKTSSGELKLNYLCKACTTISAEQILIQERN